MRVLDLSSIAMNRTLLLFCVIRSGPYLISPEVLIILGRHLGTAIIHLIHPMEKFLARYQNASIDRQRQASESSSYHYEQHDNLGKLVKSAAQRVRVVRYASTNTHSAVTGCHLKEDIEDEKTRVTLHKRCTFHDTDKKPSPYQEPQVVRQLVLQMR